MPNPELRSDFFLKIFDLFTVLLTGFLHYRLYCPDVDILDRSVSSVCHDCSYLVYDIQSVDGFSEYCIFPVQLAAVISILDDIEL